MNYASGIVLYVITQRHCGKELPKDMNKGKWEQIEVITVPSAKVWKLYIYTI